jgi:hypothetical protein
MLDGQKIYGFQWKPANFGDRVDMTEILSYDFETMQSEIIKLEGMKELQYNYEYDGEEYDSVSINSII